MIRIFYALVSSLALVAFDLQTPLPPYSSYDHIQRLPVPRLDSASSLLFVLLLNFHLQHLLAHLSAPAGLNAVFSALTEQGNTVLSMRNKANRLEELFVGLLEQGRGK